VDVATPSGLVSRAQTVFNLHLKAIFSVLQFDFSNKRVLVSGGDRGIGYAVVSAFNNAGASVAINRRTADSVEKTIRAMSGNERLFATRAT
tara:strand:- start:379 stop:651 length:273 start_codon:yes stop_codon:yes gene_type:complete